MSIIDEALSAKATIANDYDPGRGGPPTPKIAIVTCADPRADAAPAHGCAMTSWGGAGTHGMRLQTLAARAVGLDLGGHHVDSRRRCRVTRHRPGGAAIGRLRSGRTAVTDQGPARVVHRRDRMASGATVDGSST